MLASNDFVQVDNLIKKIIKSSEQRIIRKINIVISLFENEFVNLRNRVDRIEKHLNLN